MNLNNNLIHTNHQVYQKYAKYSLKNPKTKVKRYQIGKYDL